MFLLAQLAGLGLAGAGKARLPVPGARLAYYYFVVTKATVAALVRYLGSGTPQTWEKAGDAVNRATDVAVAGVGLALTSPLLDLAALAIKLEDRGPVVYRQTRVGKDGVDFEVLKLRTMVVGAEGIGAGYAVDKGIAGSHGSGASSAERRSTSCRSSGTSCAAT